MSALGRFVVLYALLYGGFGTSSPFMPRFFESRGFSAEQIGWLFGLGTVVRLFAAPVAGRLADLLRALRAVLALCMLAGAAVAVGLVRADGVRVLLAIGLVHAAVVAPTTILADALAVAASRRPAGGFEYGWVRGAASASFVAGSLVAGRVLGSAPLDAVVWMHAALLAAAALAVPLVPPVDSRAADRAPVGGVRELVGIAPYRRLVAVAALVLGSHAMHDAFAMVRWNAAGIGPGAASVLWSEAVAAEVLVFFVVGPALLGRVAPGSAMMLAASAGVIRWTTMSATTSLAALAVVQPLHGCTFALLHLACMRVIGATVPPRLAGTAQSLYAAGATAVTGALTMASGVLYGRLGARGFVVMALLCALAVPLARGIRAGAKAMEL
ncbi:MAG TPA: MFS transporter [Candidatus Binatia bacterium]|nr:MFS transporter [Candidatus Binatia bacterium]